MKPPADTHLHNKASDTTGKGHERARAILETARLIFATEGYAGLSMRGIATRLGVSLSNVQHYYPSKDALLEALLSQALVNYQATVDAHVALDDGRLRVEQFQAIIHTFLDDLSQPTSNGMFRELWALSLHNPYAAEIMTKMLTRIRKSFRNLIRTLSPDFSPQLCELRGALIAAQMQGIALYLTSQQGNPAELKDLKDEACAAIVRLATVR